MNPSQATDYFEKGLLSEKEYIERMHDSLAEREEILKKIHQRVERWEKLLKMNDHEL